MVEKQEKQIWKRNNKNLANLTNWITFHELWFVLWSDVNQGMKVCMALCDLEAWSFLSETCNSNHPRRNINPIQSNSIFIVD